MDKLILFNKAKRNKLLNKRVGESKFGEHVKILSHLSNIYDDLKSLDVTYVIIGVPEDIGIFANYGNTGASKTWNSFLKALINIQNNQFTEAKNILILGHLCFKEDLLTISKLDSSKKKDIEYAQKLVAQIDAQVTYLIHQIISAGKKPIIIGGGHNNAYGIIKGTSLALGEPINAINFDAHTDFRPEEGRHSGNGFSYAYAEGFLKKYMIFGIHENYTPEKTFKTLKKLKSVKYVTFEALEVRKTLKFKAEMQSALAYIEKKPFGLEIDCDAIQNINSSAMTPSGFSVNKTRAFINFFGKHDHVQYLHICEAAITKKKAQQTGKLITYLVTDFIKAS